ncbi:Protein LOL1 [Camellia lanceoleosa]|uniref:Protein LOL1 n=1 Tax=Camellia lanceoleosa TaxID=1840588 RepID=A0ACC0HBL9_9ERIC|nr:Protein LOL1 [Camellia lanceoleosa]
MLCCLQCSHSRATPGTEMAQLVCGGCQTLLMYIRGATSVQCSCCHTVNLALEANQVADVNCGNCRMLLMYQYGARSVKCAVCNFVTSVGASTSSTEQVFNNCSVEFMWFCESWHHHWNEF